MLSIKNIQITLVLLILFLFISSVTTIFQVPFTQVSLFLLLQILIILIPGLAGSLLTNEKSPFISMFLYSYIFGYAISIFEYFGIKATDKFLPVYIIPLIILLLSVFIIYKKKDSLAEAFSKSNTTEQLTTLIFFGLMVFFNIYVFSASNINLQEVHRDFMWWCQNSVALKLGFPPENAYITGTGTLFYHYFSSVQIAFFSLISNIDIKSLCIPLYSITKAIIMVGAVDFALNSLKITDSRVKIFGFLLVLFTTGFEQTSIVTYFHHIFLLPFGFDIGFAFGIVYIALLVRQFYKNEFDLKLFIPAMLFWFVCIGAKAPIASVLILSPALICFYWLIKKQFKLSLSYGITTLLLFLFVSYKFIGLGTVIDGTSTSWIMSLHSLSEYGGHHALTPVLRVIYRIFNASPTLTILTVLNGIFLATTFKTLKQNFNKIVLILIMLITAIFGYILWLTINAGGNSEMYYVMAAFIPLYFFTGMVFSSLFNCDEKKINNAKIISYKTISVIALIFGIILFSFCAFMRNGMIRTLSRNLKTKITCKENLEDIKPLLWLRDNSPVDSVILADNLVIQDDNIKYYYILLTERRQYLEETDMLTYADEKLKNEIGRRKVLINKIFSGDKSELKHLKNEGINYIISTNEITPYFSPDKNYAELVTSNNKFRVFKIK